MTNGNERKVAVGKTAQCLYGDNLSGVLELTHNHPDRTMVSGSDKNAASQVHSVNSSVKNNLYVKGYGYQQFNSLGNVDLPYFK